MFLLVIICISLFLENRPKIPSESCDDFRIDFKFAAVFSKKKDREPRAPPERGEADSRFVAWRFSKSS